jgi:hypothetical protein
VLAVSGSVPAFVLLTRNEIPRVWFSIGLKEKAHGDLTRRYCERAKHTRPTAALVDPRMLNAVMQAGRSFGWQRLVPLALLAFLTVQWAQQVRRENERGEEA